MIATLTLRVIKADKYTTYWQNDQDHFRDLESFLSATQPLLERPPEDANMMRGLFADLQLDRGKRFGIGQLVALPGHRPERLRQGQQRDGVYAIAPDGLGWPAACPATSTRP